MTPQEAMTLERDDVCLYQSQTYRVTAAIANGYLLLLRGRNGNVEVLSAKCQLVYRKGEVPPGFTVGLLNAEEQASIEGVIQARLQKEGH